MESNRKRELHPVWFFVILSILTIVFSAILSLVNFQGTTTEISSSLKTSTTVITVESLLSLDGFKFMFGECINNFLKFMPLGTLIVALIGIGVILKVGYLKSIFSKISKIIPRKTAFFIFSLLCIVMGFSSDLSYVIMIPIAAILFTEYKRNQVVGMTMAFVSTAAGANINLFITSIDYSLIELAKSSVNLIDADYKYGYSGNLFLIVISTLLLAVLISSITNVLALKMPVRIGDEETEIDKKLDKKGIRNSFIAFLILVIIFVYSILPGLPLSGALLDSTQTLYINKLFSANAPFVNGIIYIVTLSFIICGIIYGITTRQIKSDRDIIRLFNNSLNGIGEMLILIFVASQFISLFRYTNMGNVISINIFNLIRDGEFSFIILILLSFFGIAISGLFLPSLASKYSLFVPVLMPLFMKSNMTPEFTSAIFRLASSISNIITPLSSYFVVFIGFIGLYSKNDFSIKKCYKLLMPYLIGVIVLWLFIIIGWYVLKAPIGPSIYPVI